MPYMHTPENMPGRTVRRWLYLLVASVIIFWP